MHRGTPRGWREAVAGKERLIGNPALRTNLPLALLALQVRLAGLRLLVLLFFAGLYSRSPVYAELPLIHGARNAELHTFLAGIPLSCRACVIRRGNCRHLHLVLPEALLPEEHRGMGLSAV